MWPFHGQTHRPADVTGRPEKSERKREEGCHNGVGRRLTVVEPDTRSARLSQTPGSQGQFESFLAALAASPPPYRPPSLASGDVFADRYRVERELGRGGMGAVYLATDMELGRKVALKLAAGRRAETELLRLQQEAKVMARLSHPGIVTVFEAAAAGDDVYLSLEFVPGGTLRDWMDLGRHSWRETVAMFLPLAETLAAAHEAGVVHRDFKPQNVLLGLHGEPRIADFGLARSVASKDTLQAPILADATTTRTGAVLGTPAYMAPEQALGLTAREAADQFSFFITLYEAIVGKRPFPGKTMPAVLESIESGPPRLAPGMPRAVADIVRQGLRNDPRARHAGMQVVAARLADVLHARRRRVRNAVLLAGAAITTGVGFWLAPSGVTPCQPDVLAASMTSPWDEQTRENVSQRAGESAANKLETYRGGIAQRRLETCRAHSIAQTLSDTDFALRSACLDRAEARLSALIEDVASHGPQGLDPIPLLQDVTRCEDTVALRRYEGSLASRSKFDSAAQDAANREGLRLLTLADARIHRGEDPTELAAAARSVGQEHGLHAVEARALLLLATHADDPSVATARLDEAETITTDALPVSLSVGIAVERSNLALRFGNVELAAAHVSHAQTLARLDVGGLSPQASLEVELVQEQINLATGNSETSVESLLRIAAALPKHSSHSLFARSLLANAYVDQLQFDDADRAFARALEHPLANTAEARAPLQINRAAALVRAGRPEPARVSLDAFEAAYPDGAPDYLQGAALANRAGVLRLEGRNAEAREQAEAALRLFSSQGPAHPSIPSVLDELARIELDEEQWRPAFDRSQAALESLEGLGLANAPDAVGTLVLMSKALLKLGHPDKAAGAAKASLEISETYRRPAAEVALAQLALAAAQGRPNPSALALCKASKLEQCRAAVQ